MPRSRIVQISLPVTPQQITLLRKAAVRRGLATAADFLSALFEAIHAGHGEQGIHMKHLPVHDRSARPKRPKP